MRYAKTVICTLIICLLSGCSGESENTDETCVSGQCHEDGTELIYNDVDGSSSMWVCNNGIWEYQDYENIKK